jgi:hypothetical protein
MIEKVDMNSPEALASMQRMYDHAVAGAKKDLADAIGWQALWDALMGPELYNALAANLDEVSFERLVTLAIARDLLDKEVREWAYGKPIPEVL